MLVFFPPQLGLDNKVENTLITDSMKQRCNFMFKAILSYCMNSLKIEEDTSMSDTDPDSEDIYCTIMYNDEIHTFEQVRLIHKIIS
jgi:ATP-dependent Clp protease adaptor protein ClpS